MTDKGIPVYTSGRVYSSVHQRGTISPHTQESTLVCTQRRYICLHTNKVHHVSITCYQYAMEYMFLTPKNMSMLPTGYFRAHLHTDRVFIFQRKKCNQKTTSIIFFTGREVQQHTRITPLFGQITSAHLRSTVRRLPRPAWSYGREAAAGTKSFCVPSLNSTHEPHANLSFPGGKKRT